MAFEVGTASNMEDLLTRILRFVTGSPTISTPSYSGVGNGTLRTLEGKPGAPTETWTLTCTAAVVNGGTFSVTGSVSGAQAAATVGVAYSNSRLKFRIADGSVDFQVGDQFTFTTTAGVMPSLQRWEVKRKARDNLKAMSTSLSYSAGTLIWSARSDWRMLNTTNRNNWAYAGSGFSAGNSHFTYELNEPSDVKKVRISSSPSNTPINGLIRNFRLQWSDNGSTWTTAATITGTTAWSLSEVREYSIPGDHGYHSFWRVLIDSITSSSTVYLHTLQLLDSNGEPVNNFGSEVILRAPGNDGSDNIYTGIRTSYDANVGWYNFFLEGFTGYDANEVSFWEQPGGLYGHSSALGTQVCPGVTLWDSTTPYWLSASGRSLRMGAKVSTTYEGMYLGYMMPYASPSQYPYPLVVAGSMCLDRTMGTGWRYSDSSGYHSGLQSPGSSSTNYSPTSLTTSAAMYVRDPTGTWRYLAGRTSSNNHTTMTRSNAPTYTVSGSAGRYMLPSGYRGTSADKGREYRENLDGNYLLVPLTMVSVEAPVAVWGELEGVFHVSGFGNSAENTMTYNGDTVVCLQNCDRTTVSDYWAIQLIDD